MAITQIGTTTTDFDAGAPTSLTKSYTQVTGTNTIIVVFVGGNGSTHDTVTFDGDSLGKLIERDNSGEKISLWYRVAPTVTTANVIASFGGATDCSMIITSWDNVNQDTPFRDSAGNVGSANPSVVCNSAAGDLVIDGFCHNTDNSDPAVGDGQTELADIEVTGDYRSASSSEPGDSPTVTMDWTGFSASIWSAVAGSLQGADSGWAGKINSVTSIEKVNSVASANIFTINKT